MACATRSTRACARADAMNGFADTAFVAAIVSAAVTAIGWFATHWSAERRETQRRIEKIVDVQTALLAEIESNLTRYAETDLNQHLDEMVREITRKRQRRPFTPFVPRYVAEIVFEAVIADIHILPTETIDEVVAYYKQEYKLRELVEDLRSDRYGELEHERKALLYEDYVWQIKTVLITGSKARNALRTSLGLPAKPPALNSPDVAPIPASGNP
jgi:hypothetical protein